MHKKKSTADERIQKRFSELEDRVVENPATKQKKNKKNLFK